MQKHCLPVAQTDRSVWFRWDKEDKIGYLFNNSQQRFYHWLCAVWFDQLEYGYIQWSLSGGL